MPVYLRKEKRSMLSWRDVLNAAVLVGCVAKKYIYRNITCFSQHRLAGGLAPYPRAG